MSARLSGRRRTWQGLGRTPRKPTTPARSRRTTGQMVATKRRIRCGWPFSSTCAREKCGERPRETSTLDLCSESYDSDAVFEPGPRERAKRGLSDVLSHGAPASSAAPYEYRRGRSHLTLRNGLRSRPSKGTGQILCEQNFPSHHAGRIGCTARTAAEQV